MMRRALLLVILLFAVACGTPPVQDELSIEFLQDSDDVVLTARTRFDLNPRNADSRRRVDLAREAAVAGHDAWAVRFGRMTPQSERLTLDRTRGALESVTRSVRIPADDMHRVFSDVAITINLTRGDGMRELAIFPGASSRATRDQRRRFEDELAAWSSDVARYFTAVKVLYSYLDAQPGRARYVFAALLSDKELPVTEEEQELLTTVIDTMERIAKRIDERDARAESFAEIADLMFNPFPARMVVRVPTDVVAVEGFQQSKDDLVIEPIDLFKTIAAMEGRWISPDPLAALLREETPAPDQLAEAPRHAETVTSPSAVADALRAQLARPRNYVIRWRD